LSVGQVVGWLGRWPGLPIWRPRVRLAAHAAYVAAAATTRSM
jgi:hypothetical protein